MKWSFRHVAILPLLGSVTAIAASSGSAAPVESAKTRSAMEADPAFAVSYFKGFLSSCAKQVHGEPDIGKIACSCAAAVVVDRFTVDELSNLKSGGIDAFDKVHPGTSKLMGICGQAGKAAVAK